MKTLAKGQGREAMARWIYSKILQIFKYLQLIFLKLFFRKEIKKEGRKKWKKGRERERRNSSSSFYEASITLILKLGKDRTTTKSKVEANIADEHRVRIFNKILANSTDIHQKDYLPWPTLKCKSIYVLNHINGFKDKNHMNFPQRM